MLSIVIPVYNEEAVILETLKKLNSMLSEQKIEYEVIIVNDGSTDTTEELLKDYNDIILISRDINRGYGFSVKEGINKAKGGWILITDADGSYPIEDIPSLINESSNCDMIIGERSGEKVHFGIFNRFGKLLIKILIYALTSRWIKDINSGFRIFKKELAIKYWSLIPDSFSLTTTLTVAALIEQYRVKFVPISYFKRIGKSKIKPVQDFFNFLMLVLKIISYFKPLRFFIPISLFFLIASILRSIRDVIVANAIGSVAVLLFMISIQSFFSGF